MQRQFLQYLILTDALGHQLTGNLVGTAERQALFHQIVSQVRGVNKAFLCRTLHILAVGTHRLNHRRKHLQTHIYRIAGIKNRFLILLHILIICQRQALQRSQQCNQISVYPAGLTADQLRHIRVLLLGHNGRARGIRIAQLHKLKLPARPENDLLGEAGQMHHQNGNRTKHLQAEIPVRNTVQAILANAVKSQFFRLKVPIRIISSACQRAAADGRKIHPAAAICQTP